MSSCLGLYPRLKPTLDDLVNQFLDGVPVLGIHGRKLDVHLIELRLLSGPEDLAVNVTALHAEDIELEPESCIEPMLDLTKGARKHTA